MLTLEVERGIEAETLLGPEPKVYFPDNSTVLANWIAEGTDGNLYLVPAEAGGWLRRADYKGSTAELASVCPEEARTLKWLVYGDIGTVTILGN